VTETETDTERETDKDSQVVRVPRGQDETGVLLDGDGGAAVGARGRAAGGQAGGVHLGQVVPRRRRRLPVQRQLDVQVLGHRGVHDAAGEDVGEAAVVARAPVIGSGGKRTRSDFMHALLLHVIKFTFCGRIE